MSVKKLICLCGIVLLSLMLAMPVFAASDSAPAYVHETYINPLYADVFSEAELFPQDYQNQPRRLLSGGSQVCDSIEAAGSYVAEQMKARNTNVSVTVSGSYYDGVANDIFQLALEHSGDPTGGDYLRWQYGGWNMGGSIGSGSYTLSFTFAYYDTAEQEAELDTAVDSLLDSLDLAGKTDIEKLSAIYDYIVENIKYDYDRMNDSSTSIQYTAYAALVEKTAVCQGYSNLLYRLLLTEGIDCRIIAGKGEGQAHAWNIVKLGDVYYDVDVTWDAGNNQYKYFLRSEDNFEKHVRDGVIKPGDIDYTSAGFYASYPMSDKDYGYTFEEGVLTISGSLGKVYDYFLNNRVGKDAGIQSIVLEDGITSIGKMAFYECTSLKTVTVKGAVSLIPEYAFAHCTALETLTIPADVSVIGEAAINNCGALKDIYYGGSESDWNKVEIGEYNYPILNHTATIHFYDPADDVLASADLGERFTCSVNAENTVIVAGAESLSAQEQVLVAEFDAYGRFKGVHFITASNTSAELENDPSKLLFFWLSSLFIPKSESVSVDLE